MIQSYMSDLVFSSATTHFSDVEGGIPVSKGSFLQLGWSSGSHYIARKEMDTFSMPVAVWLKYLIFSVFFSFITLGICTAGM